MAAKVGEVNLATGQGGEPERRRCLPDQRSRGVGTIASRAIGATG
jgi:hypothetical protein